MTAMLRMTESQLADRNARLANWIKPDLPARLPEVRKVLKANIHAPIIGGEEAVKEQSKKTKGIARLCVPYPPSVNHYWKRSASGALYVGERGLQFRKDTVAEVLKSGFKEMEGSLYIKVLACPPDKRRRDIDNLLKATLDALQHANLYADDNQIGRIEITRGAVVKDGALKIEVGTL